MSLDSDEYFSGSDTSRSSPEITSTDVESIENRSFSQNPQGYVHEPEVTTAIYDGGLNSFTWNGFDFDPGKALDKDHVNLGLEQNSAIDDETEKDVATQECQFNADGYCFPRGHVSYDSGSSSDLGEGTAADYFESGDISSCSVSHLNEDTVGLGIVPIDTCLDQHIDAEEVAISDVDFDDTYIYDDFECMEFYDEDAAYALEALEAAFVESSYGSMQEG